MRELAINGTFNTRAVGRGAWLYRSAALDELSADGEASLRAEGVGLVIDLRDDAERPARLHGIRTLELPVYELPDGAPVTGSIAAVYDFLLRDRGHRLTLAVRAIANADSPVLVHCSAGKDRTGLVVALALLAAGHDETTVLADYAESGRHVAAFRSELVAARLDRLELDAAELRDALTLHLASPPEELTAALEALRERHGDVAGYLLAHGLTTEEIGRLAERLGTASHV